MHVTHIGRYEVIRVLGKGAMGVVCEARDPRLARTVAIKTIRADKLTPLQISAYEARFLTEARSVARLSHPNIVSVFDSGQADEVTYLVMEFVPGVNLKQCLHHGVKFTPWGAVKVVLDVLAALNHAHGQKILHRDVKPENILLDSAGWVKLTDFGIAKILDADEDNGTQLSGHSIGTPRYMSPEQVRGQSLDERSDLFSAGVLLYELLAARLPFDGSNQFAIAAQILNEAPPLPSVFNPAVPPELDQVVARAMAKHPAERFQTGAAFADALTAAVGPLAGGDLTVRVAGAHALVATESTGMLRWLLSRMLTGAGMGRGTETPGSAVPSQSGSPSASVAADLREPALSGSDSGPAAIAATSGASAESRPEPDDGTRVYQREAAALAATTGTGDGSATFPASGLTAGSAAHTAAPLAAPVVPAPAATAPVSAPQNGSEAASQAPAEASTGRSTVVTMAPPPTQAAAGGWWWLPAAGVLLVALVAWWFTRGAAVPPAPAVPAAESVDPRQTLSDREALVPGGSQAAGALPSPAAAGDAPADGSKTGQPASPPAGAVLGGPPAGGANAANRASKPVEAAPSGKPDAVASPQAQPAPGTLPKPTPVADGASAAAQAAPKPAEPCGGLGFLERESCLWKQCGTDAYRALAMCERFQPSKPVN